jgi:surfactin synthase thioesterase subunit
MRLFQFPEPFPVPIPVAAVHGARDQYTPPEAVGAYLEHWPAPHRFQVEPGADHFLEGRLVEATGFLSRSLKEWL